MPTFSLTDNAQNPVSAPVDWTHLSGLHKYLTSQALHLQVLPDFLGRKDERISQITPQPFRAILKAANAFQLGGATPALSFTPGGEIAAEVAATPGGNLFEDDPFPLPATIPAGSAYVGLNLTGSALLDGSASSPNLGPATLTFGFHANEVVRVGYWQAFPANGPAQPTLAGAFGRVISSFVLPGSLADLAALRPDDVCAVSGTGSLKLSGGVSVTAAPNPLASVSLPLHTGAITVQEGVMAGLSAALTLRGSYQIRARGLAPAGIELSFLQQKGVRLEADLTASAGVTANLGDKELIALLLGAIDPRTDHAPLLKGGLTPDEADRLNEAVKSSLNHTLQLSFNHALSRLADDQAAFQYRIDPVTASADPVAGDALQRALRGDLSGLTELESRMGPDGLLAPGVHLISSLLTTAAKQTAVLHVNLLGLLNVISLSELLRDSRILKDPATGDLTIADTATATRIEAVSEPPKREDRLRQAMFEAMVVTAAYRASGAVETLTLSSRLFHFAQNQNTNPGVIRDYLNWLVALNLVPPAERPPLEPRLQDSGASTCLLRAFFTDAQCRSMFFDNAGALRVSSWYLDYGRRAMLALLNDDIGPYDRYRYTLLDRHWQRAFEVGPSRQLAEVAGLTSLTTGFEAILSQLIGDVYDISWWATAMVAAGEELLSMNAFLNGRSPLSLRDDPAFATRRDALCRRMAEIVSRSKTRFHEPWGLVSLFWAAGSQGATATIVTPSHSLARP